MFTGVNLLNRIPHRYKKTLNWMDGYPFEWLSAIVELGYDYKERRH